MPSNKLSYSSVNVSAITLGAYHRAELCFGPGAALLACEGYGRKEEMTDQILELMLRDWRNTRHFLLPWFAGLIPDTCADADEMRYDPVGPGRRPYMWWITDAPMEIRPEWDYCTYYIAESCRRHNRGDDRPVPGSEYDMFPDGVDRRFYIDHLDWLPEELKCYHAQDLLR